MTLYRGLVLEGGGAKGAWQFGALKALAERDVQFDAVSGTSVGALNGAIWSANRTDFGEKMWSEIGLSSVFLQHLGLVPLLVIGGFSQLYFAFLSSLFPADVSLPKSLQWFFSALTVLPVFVVAVTYLVLADGGWLGWVVVALPTATMCMLFNDRSYKRLHFLWILALSVAVLVAVDLYGEVWGLIRMWLFWVATAPLWFVGLALATRFLNLSYFSPEPLTNTIDAVLKSGLSVPLFVTSSREVFEYVDPDNLSYFKAGRRAPVYVPLPLSAMKAEYNRIDNLSSDEAREALLASSALPFGIAPARRDSAGRRVMDGGMVDNIPWFPFVETFPCDEIIIVGCNPLPAWNDEISRDIWQLKDRLSRLIAANISLKPVWWRPPEPIHNCPPTEFPYRSPTHWPKKVTVIAPGKSLGTFTTATLKFSKQRTGEWMKAGYEAGKNIAL